MGGPLSSWYPRNAGILEKIDALHAEFPHGYVVKKSVVERRHHRAQTRSSGFVTNLDMSNVEFYQFAQSHLDRYNQKLLVKAANRIQRQWRMCQYFQVEEDLIASELKAFPECDPEDMLAQASEHADFDTSGAA